MTRNFSLVLLTVVLTMGLAMWVHAADSAPKVTGTWKWSFEGFNGTVDVIMKLQQDGSKVTGTVTGFSGNEDPIQDGTVSGDNADQLTFKIVRSFGDQTATTTYTGTVSGDSFSGKSDTTFSRDFTAQRQK